MNGPRTGPKPCLSLGVAAGCEKTPTFEVASFKRTIAIERGGGKAGDVGPVWFTVQVASGEAVLALRPDLTKLLALTPIGLTGVTVFGLYKSDTATDLEVRSFAPAEGVPEDPVCGSGNGCVAALVRREGLVTDRMRARDPVMDCQFGITR